VLIGGGFVVGILLVKLFATGRSARPAWAWKPS